MCITKEQIDAYYQANYEYLLLAIKKIKRKNDPYGKWLEEDLISIAYQHLINKMDLLKKQEDIEAFTFKIINSEILWSRGTLKRKKLTESKTDSVPMIQKYDIPDDDDDLTIKIEIEKEYNRKKAILSEFYGSLDNKIDKILYEVIFLKKKQTIDELAKHFGISKYYVKLYKKNLFDKLKQYITDNNF